MSTRRSIVRGLAALALVAAACGDDDDDDADATDGASAAPPRPTPAPRRRPPPRRPPTTERRPARRTGAAEAHAAVAPRARRPSSARARVRSTSIAWAGYVEDGSTDPDVDWVTPFEEQTGCAVNVQARQLVRRDGAADAERRVRRRVGVRRRHDAADRRRRGRAGQRRPDPELRRRLRGAQAAAAELRRRRAVRRAARPRRQPARVQHRGVRRRRARLVGRDVRRRHAGRRRGVGLRQPDLHRRRRAVPDGDAARPRHHQPVRARPGAVRRGDRPARGAEGARRPVLVAVHRPAGRARGRHGARRHDVAGDRQPGHRPTGPRSTPSSPSRARPAGPTRG